MTNRDTQGGKILRDYETALWKQGIGLEDATTSPARQTLALQTILDVVISGSAEQLQIRGTTPHSIAELVMGAYVVHNRYPEYGPADPDEYLKNSSLREHPAVQLTDSLATEGATVTGIPETVHEALIAFAVADKRGILPRGI